MKDSLGSSAEFQNVLSVVSDALASIGSNISDHDYDGLIVKKLESSNTLDEDRNTKQSHIAITGEQMNMFPYVRSDGYFDVEYSREDAALKKYFVAQIPVFLHKENVAYLDSHQELFSEDERQVYVSIVRSRRIRQTDQLQMSIINIDSPLFIKYRRIVHTGSYMVLLKRREKFQYDLYCLKPGEEADNIASYNNHFYKDSTNTPVRVDDIITEKTAEAEKIVSEYNLKFKLSLLPKMFQTPFSRRYITALLAKPFVILTGNSGTGKTRITKQFAEYLEETSENGEKNWVLVPVGADWTDNTKILGFYNPLADEGKGKYEMTRILELIERAAEEPEKPFFIILDEMNLSHVERYFSDILSHMETPDLPLDLDGYNKKIQYPSNLFIIGTVNIDETTYMFSPKVLDRANVIEFSPEKNDVLKLFTKPGDNTKITPANNGMAEAFLRLSEEIRTGRCELSSEQLDDVTTLFDRVYDAVKEWGYEFAYRTVREIRQYISAAYAISDEDGFDLRSAEDEQLLQKVLPKIHGNRKEISEMLKNLENICDEYNLPLSKQKILQMEKKLDAVQYASYI